MREPAQQRAQIVAAAFAEKAQQRVELLPRQRRGRSKPDIVAILAGQHGERDAAFARQRREPLDAVFPPVEAAEQAHHDHLGVRADPVDPQIDRHGMAQVAQMRQPHARQARALSLPGGGESGEIAVGERQHGDVARRLAEIDRFDDFVEVGRARGEQMHRLSPIFNLQARASPRLGRDLSIRSRPDGSRAARTLPRPDHIDASPASPPPGPRGAAACRRRPQNP